MPKNTAQRRIDSRRQNRATTISGVTLSGSPGSGGSAALAGDGLSYDGVALNVGAGTLITVGADSVGITAGSTYQYIGTGSGTAAAWQNLSTLAGAGLTHSAGVLAVGAGNGITVNADDVALTTPGTLTAATSNSASGSHTHAVTTGAASTLTVSTSNATGSSASLARADHLHTITSSADVTGGGTSLLASSSGNLKLYSGNIAQALASNATFASGFAGSGWRVDYGVTEAAKASAEFDNLTVRGRMRVYELLIQQIRATNGSVLVTSSSKALTVTASADPLWTVNGSQLTFNGANATLATTLYAITTSTAGEASGSRTHYHGFLTGDLIRAQQVEWDGSEFGGVYQSNLEVTGVTNLYTYQGARVDTASDAPAVGYDYVRIGSASNTTRQGVVYLTSDDSAAPFIDIVDGVASHAQWNTAGKIRARLGKLSGITDDEWGTLDGYGLWSDNVYLTGSIYATDGIFNGTVYASAGSFSGTVTASSGTIGGWSLGASALTSGSGSNTVGLDSGGTNPAIYAGSATAGSAPFRVTQAGAVTATNATITGAITASSGSLTGFLTIGSSGGIYQGTGTASTPTTGLKLWNDGGVGRIGGYNGGDLQWTADTTGKLYAGYMSTSSTTNKYALRLARDGLRLTAEATGSYAVSTSASAIRWIYNSTGDVDGTIGSGETYTALYSYNNTTSNSIYTGLMTFVGSAVYTTKDSVVYLSAQQWTGTVTKAVDFLLTTYKSTGNTLAYCNADIFQLTKALKFDEMTAPSAPSANQVVIYAEDNGSGKTRLMALFSSGAAQQIAIQP